MRLVALTAIVTILSAASHGGDVACQMDAAEQKDGVRFSGYAAVRAIIDNSEGTEDLTDVRFSIEIHSGTFAGIGGWSWTSTDNPWYGARAGDTDVTRDGLLRYSQATIYYPPARQWAPAYFVERLPGHPEYTGEPVLDEYLLSDTVPAGFVWDRPIKLLGFEGSDIELFSTATGELASNELTVTLYDTDPEPQTVPEPATLCLLGVGAVGLIRRRR